MLRIFPLTVESPINWTMRISQHASTSAAILDPLLHVDAYCRFQYLLTWLSNIVKWWLTMGWPQNIRRPNTDCTWIFIRYPYTGINQCKSKTLPARTQGVHKLWRHGKWKQTGGRSNPMIGVRNTRQNKHNGDFRALKTAVVNKYKNHSY